MMRVLFLAFLALLWASPAQSQTFVSPSAGVQKVNGVLPDVAGNVTIPSTQFVATCTPIGAGLPGPCTLATLLATYPCSATYVGQYADISDLYNNGVTGGGIEDVTRCRYDATNLLYRWTPQREAYNTVNPTTSGTLSINPLVTPPTVRMTGTLLGNVTFNALTANAYVGQRVRIVMNGSIGIFAATITGLIGSNLTLLGGSTNTIEYGPTGWFTAGN